jgi:DNA-binding NarL/FixJ family response regulator
MARILIVDDAEFLRVRISKMLIGNGHQVIEANNGLVAVNTYKTEHPDVVLMDITMPDLNGIEAARVIHAKCPAARIVMLSMHATAEYVYRAFEAGACGYLLKEAAVDEVITAVRTVHGGRQYLSPALAESVPGSGAGYARGPVDSLSTRERQVLQLVVEGCTSSEIAGMIHLSPKSVETYRSRLMSKLGVRDLPSLVKFALEHGLTPPK